MTLTSRPPDRPRQSLAYGWLILAGVVLVLFLGAAVSVYAYDASHRNDVAEGVTVGGVEVGGLSAARAEARLRRQLVTPLRAGIAVEWRGRTFRLSGRRARVAADVDRMVREAVARSREGNVLGRAMRDLAGEEVDADIPARLSYSRPAVRRFVRRVKGAIDRPAQDARVDPSPTGLSRVRSRTGRSVRAARLRRKVVSALLHPGDGRTVRPSVAVTRPEVTTGQLASRYPWYITIDRGGKRLRVFRRLRLVDSYLIAVGQAGYETPAGVYSIQDKQVDPAWHVPPDAEWAGGLAGRTIPPGSPQNPLKARWMGFFAGAGIHGTAETGSLGTNASHGCIRMSVPDVKELYDMIPTGTPLYIGG